jgi:hypothetical protein
MRLKRLGLPVMTFIHIHRRGITVAHGWWRLQVGQTA